VLKLPGVRSRVTRSDEEGRPVEYTLEPAVSDPTLAVQRLHRVAAVGEQPAGRPEEPDPLMSGGASGRLDEDLDAEWQDFVEEQVNSRLGESAEDG
jgi:hypothetical protein